MPLYDADPTTAQILAPILTQFFENQKKEQDRQMQRKIQQQQMESLAQERKQQGEKFAQEAEKNRALMSAYTAAQSRPEMTPGTEATPSFPAGAGMPGVPGIPATPPQQDPEAVRLWDRVVSAASLFGPPGSAAALSQLHGSQRVKSAGELTQGLRNEQGDKQLAQKQGRYDDLYDLAERKLIDNYDKAKKDRAVKWAVVKNASARNEISRGYHGLLDTANKHEKAATDVAKQADEEYEQSIRDLGVDHPSTQRLGSVRQKAWERVAGERQSGDDARKEYMADPRLNSVVGGAPTPKPPPPTGATAPPPSAPQSLAPRSAAAPAPAPAKTGVVAPLATKATSAPVVIPAGANGAVPREKEPFVSEFPKSYHAIENAQAKVGTIDQFMLKKFGKRTPTPKEFADAKNERDRLIKEEVSRIWSSDEDFMRAVNKNQ